MPDVYKSCIKMHLADGPNFKRYRDIIDSVE